MKCWKCNHEMEDDTSPSFVEDGDKVTGRYSFYCPHCHSLSIIDREFFWNGYNIEIDRFDGEERVILKGRGVV